VATELCWKWQEEVEHLLRQAFGFNTAQWPRTLEGLIGLKCEVDQERPAAVPRDPRKRPDHYHPVSSKQEGQELRRPRPETYAIDVRHLVRTLTGTRYEYLMEVTEMLGVALDKGWCAGNECRALFQAWEAMASGPAIDESRETFGQSLNTKVKKIDASTAPPDVPVLANAATIRLQDEMDQDSNNDERASKKPRLLFDESFDDDDEESAPTPKPSTGKDPYAELHKYYENDDSD